MTTCPGDEEEELRLDMLIYGQCFEKDGKRIDPQQFYATAPKDK